MKTAVGMSDELSVSGKLELTIVGGVANPPGTGWHVEGVSLDRLLRNFEGAKIQVTITVLDSAPAEPRRMRTIRDLTEPR